MAYGRNNGGRVRLGTATVIGIGSMLVLIALGSRQEIIGLVTLVSLSIFVYLVQTRASLARQ